MTAAMALAAGGAILPGPRPRGGTTTRAGEPARVRRATRGASRGAHPGHLRGVRGAETTRRREARLTSPARAVREYVLRYWGRYARGRGGSALRHRSGADHPGHGETRHRRARARRGVGADHPGRPDHHRAGARQRRGSPPLTLSAARGSAARGVRPPERPLRRPAGVSSRLLRRAPDGRSHGPGHQRHHRGEIAGRLRPGQRGEHGRGLRGGPGGHDLRRSLADLVGAPSVPGARPRGPRGQRARAPARPRPCRNSSARSRAWCRNT